MPIKLLIDIQENVVSEEKSSTPGLSNIAVLLFAGFAYLAATHGPQLHDTRPALPATADLAPKSAGLEARMWQDPFQVIALVLKRERDHPTGTSAILSRAELARSLASKVIVVMVPGDRYEEAAETRRRRRYGVLTAYKSPATFRSILGRSMLPVLDCRTTV